MKILFKILISMFLINIIAHAEIIDFGGDFSSRSVILKQINAQKATQEQIDLLTEKKLSLSTKCLLEQIKKNNIENVKLLLEAKLNPNQDYLASYPLFIACKQNNYEIAQLLLNYGAKPNKFMESELYEAIKNKNSKLSMLLIEYGADVRYVSPVGDNSVLYLSLKNKMFEISKLLIEKGAKIDEKAAKYINKNKLNDLLPN